jgi:putrescine transport system permease protein
VKLDFNKFVFLFRTTCTSDLSLAIKYAAITTALCLAIGYPFAYFMARAARACAGAADAGDAAVLDLVPAARLFAWKGLLAEQRLGSTT